MKKKKKTKKKKTKGKKKTKWLNKPKWHCRAIVTFYTVNRYTISGSTHWTHVSCLGETSFEYLKWDSWIYLLWH